MSKMTDEQIIKHIFGCENKDCRVMVIFNKPEDTIDEITIGDIADIINRQQAEIEKLNVELVGMRGACNSYKMHYDNAKAEIERLERHTKMYHELRADAIEEYMKIFEEKLSQNTDISNVGYQSIIFDMEQGYKEMVGEGK